MLVMSSRLHLHNRADGLLIGWIWLIALNSLGERENSFGSSVPTAIPFSNNSLLRFESFVAVAGVVSSGADGNV